MSQFLLAPAAKSDIFGIWNYYAAEVGDVELATSAEEDGGADKDRTCDLLNAIQALYQLSYDPIRSGE